MTDDQGRKQPPSNILTKATFMQTAPGHEVLAAAGKKYLRPGGRIATEQLRG